MGDNLSSPFHAAATNGDISGVQRLLFMGVDVDIQEEDNHNYTALHLAAWNGYTELVEVLIEEFGAALELKTSAGSTPLHCAAGNGHKDTVSLLLRKGASAGATDDEGRTPLFLAAFHGFDTVCGAIVTGSLMTASQLDTEDTDGRSPMFMAANHGHINIVRLLLQKKASVSKFSRETKQTVIHVAARRCIPDMMNMLLNSSNQCITYKDMNKQMPLHTAITSIEKNETRCTVNPP